MFYQAYQNFFKSTQGNRKGKPIRPPKFKRRMSLPTARFTKGGFKVGQHKVYVSENRKAENCMVKGTTRYSIINNSNQRFS